MTAPELPQQCLVMDRGAPDGRQFSLRTEVSPNHIDYTDIEGWSLPEVVQAAYAAGFRPRHWVQISTTGSTGMIAEIPLSVIPKA